MNTIIFMDNNKSRPFCKLPLQPNNKIWNFNKSNFELHRINGLNVIWKVPTFSKKKSRLTTSPVTRRHGLKKRLERIIYVRSGINLNSITYTINIVIFMDKNKSRPFCKLSYVLKDGIRKSVTYKHSNWRTQNVKVLSVNL